MPPLTPAEQAAAASLQQYRSQFPNAVWGAQYGPDQRLGLEDINLPGLSNADRYYLAGLAYMQNPNDPAARANYNSWRTAMGPQPTGPPGNPYNEPDPYAATPATTTPAPTTPAPTTPAVPPWQAAAMANPQDPWGAAAGADYLGWTQAANEWARANYSGPEMTGMQSYTPPTRPTNWGPTPGQDWGGGGEWTPPPMPLHGWGPPPQAPKQAPTPRQEARRTFLRESGVGPRPQAPVMPQGWNINPQVENFYRQTNPTQAAAWDAYGPALKTWQEEANRYLPDFRAKNPWTPPPTNL